MYWIKSGIENPSKSEVIKKKGTKEHVFEDIHVAIKLQYTLTTPISMHL